MEIATVSLNPIWEDKEANLILCESYIKDALSNGVKLVIFPEMTLTGFSNNIKKIAEEERHSVSVQCFQKLAKRYKIAIIFGVAIIHTMKAENQSYFINELGDIIEKYAKIHPFSFSGEDEFIYPGNHLAIADYYGYKIWLTICYDLRFPELYSALGKDCDLIINIANWPKNRVEHWHTLLKVRAIENQIFVIGVNRTGKNDNDLEYKESSDVYNANGDVLICKQQVSMMKIYGVDKDWTKAFRNKFMTVNDRNIEFYKGIL